MRSSKNAIMYIIFIALHAIVFCINAMQILWRSSFHCDLCSRLAHFNAKKHWTVMTVTLQQTILKYAITFLLFYTVLWHNVLILLWRKWIICLSITIAQNTLPFITPMYRDWTLHKVEWWNPFAIAHFWNSHMHPACHVYGCIRTNKYQRSRKPTILYGPSMHPDCRTAIENVNFTKVKIQPKLV